MPGRLRSLLLACSLGLLPLLLLGGLTRTARAAGPWYVAPGGSDAADCLSPATACASINAAIGKASAGDTVYVATGIYTTASESEVVLIDKDITLSGGWEAGFAAQTGLATIDGEQQRRGLWIAANRTVVLDRISVERGYWPSFGFLGGGGVYVDLGSGGSLTLNHSRVISSSALGAGGGVWYYGELVLNQSQIRDNMSGTHGGGVAGPTTATVNSSAVTGNWTSGNGGGLWNGGGLLSMNDSTVSGNHAEDDGGGVWSSGPANLNSSTFTENQAANGGGVFQTNFALVTLRNSLVAQNTANQGADCAGDLTSAGYNLVGSTAQCAWAGATGDLLNLQPQIGPLVGSPAYHPLASTSPAVNAGNPGGCQGSLGLLTTDQRGHARVGRCDIGAYEYSVPGPATLVEMISGTQQTRLPLGAYGSPLQVRVFDGVGSPVGGVPVLFAAPATGPSVSFASGTYTATALTDQFGLATSGVFTANALLGPFTVSASVSGVITPATFALANVAWYVSPAGSDSHTCASPAASCASLNRALSQAAPGDTIFVGTGTYTAASGSSVVWITQTVNLSGGWDAAFAAQTGHSTINGGGVRTGVTADDNLGAASPMITRLDRFEIINTHPHGIYGVGTLYLSQSFVHNSTGTGLFHFRGTLALDTTAVNHHDVQGLLLDGGTLTLTNSTVSHNVFYGAQTSAAGQAYFYNSTVTNNGLVDLFTEQNSAVRLQNSLVGNCGGSGTVTSGGYNLVGSTQGCAFSAGVGDQANLSLGIWPELEEPSETVPLILGSRAINRGNPAGCLNPTGQLLAADQRGVARVGACDVGAYEFDRAQTQLHFLFVPALSGPCGQGLCGVVRLGGGPAANVALDLRFYDGATWSTAASTTTNGQGQYDFTGVASLQPGQRYYVRYLNQAGTPGRLSLWQTRVLDSYTAGTRMDLGSFDIADVVLTAPPADALVTLPHTFTWVRRAATPTDSYELDVYDPVDGDPNGYTPLLGYVNGVTITGLPDDFATGATYVWEIWIYSADGGVGISREARPVRFANHGAAAGAAALDGGLRLSPRLPRPEDPVVAP